MPLSIWTPFTADRSVLAGGQALAAGIGHGLESLGDQIGKALDKQKQRGQLASALRKTLSVAYPEQKDQFAAMGKDDLEGFMEGKALESARAKAEQSRRLDEMRIGEALAQQRLPRTIMQALAEQEGANRTPGQAMAGRGPLNDTEFDASMARSNANVSPISRALIEGAARSGTGLPPAVLSHLLSENEAGGIGQALRFEEDPVTGNRFARQGKSVLPSGLNPAKQSTEAEELYDPDGNVIGHRVPIGGGKFTFRPMKPIATGELMPVLDPLTKRAVPNMGMDASGHVHDYRDAKQKSGLTFGGAKATEADRTAQVEALKADAKRAISLGADPAKVNARLNEALQKLAP